MEISKALELKRSAETKIRNIMLAFEKETRLTIDRLDFTDTGRMAVQRDIIVEITVKL